jgi:predicted RecA/RadA family phage recombinase
MAKNFIQNGDVIPFVAGATITSGELVQVGSLFGVAQNDYANGETGELVLKGVYTIPKTTGVGTALTAGAPAYYDTSEGAAVNGSDESAANPLCGYAIEAAGDDDATAKVKLLG